MISLAIFTIFGVTIFPSLYFAALAHLMIKRYCIPPRTWVIVNYILGVIGTVVYILWSGMFTGGNGSENDLFFLVTLFSLIYFFGCTLHFRRKAKETKKVVDQYENWAFVSREEAVEKIKTETKQDSFDRLIDELSDWFDRWCYIETHFSNTVGLCMDRIESKFRLGRDATGDAIDYVNEIYNLCIKSDKTVEQIEIRFSCLLDVLTADDVEAIELVLGLRDVMAKVYDGQGNVLNGLIAGKAAVEPFDRRGNYIIAIELQQRVVSRFKRILDGMEDLNG